MKLRIEFDVSSRVWLDGFVEVWGHAGDYEVMVAMTPNQFRRAAELQTIHEMVPDLSKLFRKTPWDITKPSKRVSVGQKSRSKSI